VKKVLPTWIVSGERASIGKFRAAVGCPFRQNPSGETNEQATTTTQMNWRTNWRKGRRADAVEPADDSIAQNALRVCRLQNVCVLQAKSSTTPPSSPLSPACSEQRASAASWKSNSPLSFRLPAGRQARKAPLKELL